ncbi:MAG: type II toxin-antitoxin system VapC family toxin [Deltaproteobacteria bacterium]|nr:type II toxin-antitoxin system VapC family toxin [Deltaproteobacteria bacterium]
MSPSARNVVVPDASVLLKWGLDPLEEDNLEQAALLQEAWLDGRIDIVLPGIWAFEVGNVLALKKPAQAEELMEIFLGYRLPEAETTPELYRATFRLMKACRVTFYDAVYHAVADLHRGTLVTADEAYCRKTVGAGKGKVVLLREWIL